MFDTHRKPEAPSSPEFARIAVLSGAGLSAESGVPTFRDKGMAIWSGYNPREMASMNGWLENPERVWAWYLWRYHQLKEVKPNEGHRAVAAWQENADVAVITQNLDDLHERAGSHAVHHLHGSIAEFRCDTCESPYLEQIPDMAQPQTEIPPPRCECGGRIRPGIVWFGEQLPSDTWDKAVDAATAADLLVVVGTSGEVYPAASLPDLALDAGTVVVEINPERTPLSDTATITLREQASAALPGLLHRLRGHI